MYSSCVNMWIILLWFFINLQKASLDKNEAGSTPMYTAVVSKCPFVKNTTLKESPIFTNDCKNWKVSVTNETKDYKRCMLYYDSLILFCTQFDNEWASKFLQLFALDLKTVEPDVICSKLPKETLLKKNYSISTYGQCLQLCFNGVDIDERCKFAYYYITFNFTKLEDHSKNAKKVPFMELDLSNTTSKAVQNVSNAKLETNADKVKTGKPKGDPAIDPPINLSEQNSNPTPKISISNKLSDDKKNEEIKTEQVKTDSTELSTNNLEENVNLKDHAPNPLGADKSNDMEGEFEPDDEDSFNEQDHVENNAELNVQIKKVKPNTVEDEPMNNFNNSEDEMDGDSYFFSYFTVLMCLCIVGYVGYHNRQKILALILEGKRGRRSSRGRRSNSINYHKLDSNLEEAISSSCPKGSTNIIY